MDADTERLQKAVNELAEHYDTVHIFVTREEDDLDAGGPGTMHTFQGHGNWMARYGQIRMWMIKEEERTRIQVRAEEEEK